MFDQFLDVAGNFDLITPAWAFVQDMLNGPPADFGIPAQCGWTSRDIQRLLTRHGVKVWGLIYHGDMLMFTVRKAQARWAYYLLCREKVPILYAPTEAMDAPARPRRHTPRLSRPLRRVFDLLDRLEKGRF